MGRPGAMAVFAAYREFGELNRAIRAKRYRAGRVAFETSGDSRGRIGGLVEQSRGLRQRCGTNRRLARGWTPRMHSGIVTGVVFHVPILVDLRAQGHSLASGS